MNRIDCRRGRRRGRSGHVIAIAIAAVFAPSVTRADTNSSWKGEVSGLWTTATNWSTTPNYPNNGTPSGTNYDAFLSVVGGTAYTVTLNSNITINELTVASPDVTLTQSAGSLSIGSLNMSAGTFNVGGTLSASTVSQTGGLFSDAGTLLLAGTGGNAATYQFSGGTLSVGTLAISSGGTLNWSAGTLNVTAAGQVFNIGTSNATGPLGTNLTLNLGQTLLVSGNQDPISDNGVLNLTGGQAITSGTNSSVIIGNHGTGSATVTGVGAKLSAAGELQVGYLFPSAGSLTIANGGLVNAGSIVIGDGGTAFVTISGSGSTLSSTGSLTIGHLSGGSLSQSDGTVSASSLYLTTSSSSPGVYNLNNAGSLSISGSEYIGFSDVGTFNQTGGTNTAGGTLSIGSSGVYKLAGGTLNVGTLAIASGGKLNWNSGTLNVTASTLTIGSGGALGSTLSVGNNQTLQVSKGNAYLIVDGGGSLGISGTGALSMGGGGGYEVVGGTGVGTLIQTGGTHSINQLTVAQNSSSQGYFSLGGNGSLSAVNEVLGMAGAATFNQNGGTNSVGSQLTLGGSGAGTYLLSAGTLSTSGGETLGLAGAGTFLQSGGTNVNSGLSLAFYSTANGYYGLSGTGSLSDSGYATIGSGAAGTFNQSGGSASIGTLSIGTTGFVSLSAGTLSVGTINSSGTFNFTGGALNIANSSLTIGSAGLLGSSETLGAQQSLGVNNGVTVATDGSLTINGGTVSTSQLTNNGQLVFNNGTINGQLINTASSAVSLGNAVTITGGLYQASTTPLLIGTGQTVTTTGTFAAATSNAPFAFLTTVIDGTLNLSGTLSVNDGGIGGGFGVGLNNPGNVTQSGGTLDATGDYVSVGYNNTGTYTLNSGTILASQGIVATDGAGTFNQIGGIANLNWVVGSRAAGTYNLSGGTTSFAIVGGQYHGVGIVNQTGGAATGTTLFLGYGGTGPDQGTYNLGTAGSLAVSRLIFGGGYNTTGGGGQGVFNQNAGTVSASVLISLGFNPIGSSVFYTAGSGQYNLGGGTLTTPALFIGGSDTASGGVGTYSQTGGTANIGSITLWNNASSATLNGGTLNVGTVVKNGGAFTFNSGTLNLTAGSLAVTQTGLLGKSISLTANKAITLSGSTNIAADGSLVINGGAFTTGSLTIANGGTFSYVTGSVNVLNDPNFITTYILGNNGSLASGQSVSTNGSLTLAAGGTVTINGGSLNVGGGLQVNNSSAISIQSGSTTAGSVNLGGGAATIAGGSLTAGSIANAGTFNVTGGTVTTPSFDFPFSSAGQSIGTAVFSQSAGSTVINGPLAVGDKGAAGACTINLSGGSLYADTILLGSTAGGVGAMNVASGATVTVGGGLLLDQLSVNGGSVTILNQPPPASEDSELADAIVGGYLIDGTLSIGSGTVSTPYLKLGITSGKTGTLVQSGGAATIGTLSLGCDTTTASGAGVGSANVSGGTLSIGTILIGSSVGGVGTLRIGSTATVTAGSVVNGGTLLQSGGTADLGAISGNGYLATSNSAILSASVVRQATLSVNDSSSVSIAAAGTNASTSNVKTLTMSATGTLDLANNDLIVDYNTSATPLQSIKSSLGQGYHGGAYDQPGILSSSAKLSGGTNRIGYAEAASLGSTSFDGQTINGGAVLLKYTVVGDTTLKGSVGLQDYNTLVANFNTGTLWTQGNFHYSGTTGLQDYNALVANFNGNVATNHTAGGSVLTLNSTAAQGNAVPASPAASDLRLEVNTVTGDVYVLAAAATNLTGYNIFDAKSNLQDSGNSSAGNPNRELLLSVDAAQGGNTTTYRSSTNYRLWSLIKDNATSLSEGENNARYTEGTASTYNTIVIPAGGTIDFGNIFGTVGNIRDLTFQFSEANASDGNPVSGPTFSGSIDYLPAPEPTTALPLAAVAMMSSLRRCRRENSRLF